MVTELRIRKMLDKKKISYPSKEALQKRTEELNELYQTLKTAMVDGDSKEEEIIIE